MQSKFFTSDRTVHYSLSMGNLFAPLQEVSEIIKFDIINKLHYKDLQHFVLSIFLMLTPPALTLISYKHSPYAGTCLYKIDPRVGPSDLPSIGPKVVGFMTDINHVVI